ncbi:YfhE family protein [Oceanobacillus chungangensis]|uniref:YfhE family protein n=1 Tax=Oceanobacillus chungangensis TaxID=1229152 RepID=A0A3D8PQJ0_9BACI|nr:YfhE family protein [Oceanobacillus chungangensis]RDW17449.1 YfhE family protein [Oceanobacillus chungangensis]
MSKFKENRRLKYLSKTQEVNYQKEFKRADRIYEQLSQRGSRS